MNTNTNSNVGVGVGTGSPADPTTTAGVVPVPPRKRYFVLWTPVFIAHEGEYTEYAAVRGNTRGTPGGAAQQARSSPQIPISRKAPSMPIRINTHTHTRRSSAPTPDVIFQLDHSEISLFMQDIDTRKPLNGRSRIFAAQSMARPGGDVEDQTKRSERIWGQDDLVLAPFTQREVFHPPSLPPPLLPSPTAPAFALGSPRRFSSGLGSTSLPISNQIPKRSSYTGSNIIGAALGLSPPSSPLR
ncbi:hypothetical protein BDP27DRAFT_1426449 [Rhodocollybia butyracea]|uniref:Uncharacterized protein n=1 Tax=Rhodocollybia butyracea TaxID=206335 RepID=A0A9P5PJS4_9AGAR|nr:hypothetical protein BDP27DRAFT_1426449 [Rhodocollybia butyracea]